MKNMLIQINQYFGYISKLLVGGKYTVKNNGKENSKKCCEYLTAPSVNGVYISIFTAIWEIIRQREAPSARIKTRK